MAYVNVLPGERLTSETLDYIEQTIAHGGSMRGASDRALRTLRVVVDGRTLRFEVEVREGDRVLGVGTHERRMVDRR